MDMKKILEAMNGVNARAEVNSSDMKKFLTIVEGKGPLNRPTAAESITMQHYTTPKKTITAPVLNVQEGAKPSMIGKYFKTVEQELKEAAEKPNERAQQLAERVIERVVGGQETPPGINRLTGKPIEPEPAPAQTPTAPSGPKGANLKMTVLQQLKAGTYKGFAPKLTPEEIDAAIAYKQAAGDLQEQYSYKDIAEMARLGFDDTEIASKLGFDLSEGLKDPKDNPCWKGYKPVGTKKKGGKTVPNCVPKE